MNSTLRPTLEQRRYIHMEIDGIIMLPREIITTNDLTSEFKEMFKSKGSRERGVVYFIMSIMPVPRLNGESNILYIGKTKRSIYDRYHSVSELLASNFTGDFYRHIIKNFGGIKMGYIKTDSPKETESKIFEQYQAIYFEYPPKSKSS